MPSVEHDAVVPETARGRTLMRLLGARWRLTGAVALLLLGPLAPAAWAAGPFVGSWSIESFGQAEQLVFQFTSDTTLVISVGDEKAPAQSYSVDTARKELTLPLSDGNEITLRYVLQGVDSFVLYMGPELLEQMVGAFTASLPQGANPLTDQVVEELRKAVRDVFLRSPFMRGTRIR